MFDNSDYPSNHQFFDATNKKIIGKFKDEAAGIPITEFVGLRSKMYSYIKENNNGGKQPKESKRMSSKKKYNMMITKMFFSMRNNYIPK